MDETTQLEDLPYELISLIFSYLDLDQILALSFLSRTLNFVVSSPTTTPLHPPIRALLDAGPPYPHSLATLGTYTHIPRSVFLPVLVRASAQWILEDMVLPAGLTDDQWHHCFLSRFLPSWTRYRDPPTTTTWRAAFLRVLRRLVHRHSGCTHEESWTRFIILHRNGTASLNRIYSRTFDPLEIYAEIRRQNDLLSMKQEVRLVVQLQDVRVLVLGTMAPPRSLFVNPSAYVLLHPPGLEEQVVDDEPAIREHGEASGVESTAQPPSTPNQDQTNRTTRSLSLPQPPPAAEPTAHSSTSGLGAFVKRLRAGSITANTPATATSSSEHNARRSTSWLHRTTSRESTHGRRPSLSLSRTTTHAIARVISSASGGAGEDSRAGEHRRQSGEDVALAPSSNDGQQPSASLPAPSSPPPPTQQPEEQEQDQQGQLPYPRMRLPLPAPSHALYPNWTPPGPSAPECHDVRAGRRVARDQQKYLASAVPVGAEWDDEAGWRTWIGPVLIIAQLAPATQYASSHPPSPHLDPPLSIDGPIPPVSLGPAGLYASFDWEDLDALFPWLELRQVENGNEPLGNGVHRAGLGFVH